MGRSSNARSTRVSATPDTWLNVATGVGAILGGATVKQAGVKCIVFRRITGRARTRVIRLGAGEWLRKEPKTSGLFDR